MSTIHRAGCIPARLAVALAFAVVAVAAATGGPAGEEPGTDPGAVIALAAATPAAPDAASRTAEPPSPASPAPAPAATPVGRATAWGTLETPGAAPVTLVIRNDGPADRLVAASSPAARVDLHRTAGRGRDRAMHPLPAGIPIPPGLSVLDAAGDHPMLAGVRRDLAQGDGFPLRLRFADAGAVEVTVRVRRRLDAAGLPPIPPVRVGPIEVLLASAPPAPAPEGGRECDPASPGFAGE